MSLGSTPQRCIRSPAMMKNGMASRGNESMPPNMRVGSTAMGTAPERTMKARPPRPRQKAMGTPRIKVSVKTTIRRVMSTSRFRPGRPLGHRARQTEEPGDDHERQQERAHGKGEVEPEDRHPERQRVLLELRGKDLESGHRQHEEEEDREEVGAQARDPLAAWAQPAGGPRSDVTVLGLHEHGGEEGDPDHPVARELLGDDQGAAR